MLGGYRVRLGRYRVSDKQTVINKFPDTICERGESYYHVFLYDKKGKFIMATQALSVFYAWKYARIIVENLD